MKNIVLSIALIIASTTVFSQVTFKPGIRTGVNFSSIEKIEADSKVGFYAGAFCELNFGGYALQPEISFSQQGAKNVDLDYLTVTIVNKFYPLKEETPIYISVGPSLEFNLNGGTENYNNSTRTSTGVNFETDFSLVGGIGYSLPIGIDVELRYKKGLVDVFHDGDLAGRSGSVFQIGVSYKFDFSK